MDLRLRTLMVSIWNFDRLGRNIFLGEVLIPMDERTDKGLLNESFAEWYDLQDQVSIKFYRSSTTSPSINIHHHYHHMSISQSINQSIQPSSYLGQSIFFSINYHFNCHLNNHHFSLHSQLNHHHYRYRHQHRS